MTENYFQMINQKWEIVQHNWHETSIYCQDQRVCKLDTEDWGVNEDNQYELEDAQLNVAKMIAAAPEMHKILQEIGQDGKVSPQILAQIQAIISA